ncbi:MAG: hypothetical protein QOK37_2497 [Thermoanaerobaculia bacterium]|nr:hypothetical protein [Thermoanaerobaculia bacterium]
MAEPSVDDLRRELRERGYLSHAIERWFAHDPWSSRTFWRELITVAAKASLLVALFAIVPLVAVMVFRNHPLSAGETLLLSFLYGVTGFAISILILVAVALALKLRPAMVIDTPRALLAISFAVAALLASPIVFWWYRFPAPPSWPELLAGIAAIAAFFLIGTIAISAALLSFSIYELQRIPAIHRRPRGVPMTIAASILIALLFLPAFASSEARTSAPPLQVVTVPGERRVALLAVDGLTWDIYHSRPDLTAALVSASRVATLRAGSTTERWASLGTGVKTYLHGVRAVEGVRLRGGAHLMQSVSPADIVLRNLAEAIGLGRLEPLPPTVRRRDFVWEIFAARGIPSVAVNWWTSPDARVGALDSVGQESIFNLERDRTNPVRAALSVDENASARFLYAVEHEQPRFATVYLPALDIVLNRLTIGTSEKLTSSVRALDNLVSVVTALRKRRFDVIVVGMPGDNQGGEAVFAVAAPLSLTPSTTPFDVAPTLCSLMGFPASSEMSGKTRAGRELTRISTYGPRVTSETAPKVNDEYYQNLKSLGYIR